MAKALGVKVLVQLYVAAAWVSIGGQDDCTLTMSAGTAETTDKDSANWKEEIVAIREWSIAVSGKYADSDSAIAALKDAWLAQTTLQARAYDETASQYYTGTVNVPEFTVGAPLADASTFSATLAGTGELAES